ncbi:MAG: hypothetical protein FWG77_11290 [Treponema sp.]|nr:hypothetical protein [Treponema sp.]
MSRKKNRQVKALNAQKKSSAQALDTQKKAVFPLEFGREYNKFHQVLFAILTTAFFVFSPVEFIPKLLAFLISVPVCFHIRKLKFVFNRWYEIPAFIFVNIYLSYAVFGFEIFILDSLQLPNGLTAFTLFTFCNIWMIYVLQSTLDLLKTLGDIKSEGSSFKGKYWQKWLILFTILFSVFMLWQRAFNPIVMSPDSWDFISGWLNGIYVSYWSPVYKFILTIILSLAPLKPEVQWVAFTQISAFSALLASILMYLDTKKYNFILLIFLAIIVPLIPSYALHTLVIWADLTTGMSVLWLTYTLIRIIDDVIIQNSAKKRQQISFCIQLCLSMTLCFFIRPNTFLVFIIMVPVLIIFFLFYRKWKFLFSVVLSISLVLLIRYPGYRALGIGQPILTDIQIYEPQRSSLQYLAGLHDIRLVYYNYGNLSYNTLNSLRRYVPKLDDPEVINSFMPGNASSSSSSYDLQGLTTLEFIKMYADTFIRNPFTMIRAMSIRTLTYWVIKPQDYVTWINFIGIWDLPNSTYMTEAAPSLGVYRQHNFLTVIFSKYLLFMTLPFFSMLFWRFGLWTSLTAISILSIFLKRKYIVFISFFPVIAYLISIYLSVGWPDFRYGLPVLFSCMFLTPLTIKLDLL